MKKRKKKSPLRLVIYISIIIIILTSIAIKIHPKEPVKIFDSFDFNTTEGFDVQKLFNQQVNLNNYEIAYVSDDELKKVDNDLDVGTYEIIIKDKKTSFEYESLVTIVDNSGPQIEFYDKDVFNSRDYLEIATFVKKCTDNVSYECRYNVYDEEENIVTAFSHEEGLHTYLIEAYDENDNKTIQEITYTIDDSIESTSMYGVYYSSEKFTSDNPIAKQALSYVGINGYNCEAFFYMNLFNTPGIKEKILTYSDRQTYINENRYEVSLLEAMPGDELRFTNNGYGQPHVAIYIGNGMAVHGGFAGSNVVVFDALTPIASIPKVYRYKI